MTTTMARKVIAVLGAVYLLIGVLGFVPALVVPTAVAGQGLLLGTFAVNAIHNLAHLILGALMLYASTSSARFWLLSRTLAAVFAVLVVGSVIAPIAEGVAINLPDTGLHLISATAMAYLAFASKPDAAGQLAVA